MRTIHRYATIMENVQAAKALLKKMGVTDTSGFNQIKDMVGNSLGYVNFLTKLLYVDQAGMEEVRNIWRTIESEPQVVAGFSKPAADLDTAEQFWDEYNRSRDKSLAKRALDELPSLQKSLVSLDNPDDRALLKALWQDPDKANFIKKVSRYKTKQTLVQAMRGFVYNKTSNDFDKVLSNLEGLDIPVLHSDRDMGIIISLVMDWQKLRKVAGDTSWCIVSSEQTFRSYLSRPLSLQFVIFNFDVAPNYRKIGVTTYASGYNTAHLVDDRRFPLRDLTEFLDARGLEVSMLYPTRDSMLDYGMDGLRVQDLLNVFTKEEIFAKKKSYDIRDFVFLADAGTDKESIKSMARRVGIKITGPVSSMLKFYTPDEILGMKDSYDIDDLVSLIDAGVDKQRIRRKAMELGIEIEGPVYRLLKFYSPYDLLEMKKEFTSQDFAFLAKAGDRERIRSMVFDKGTRIVGPVEHMFGVFSPDEAVKMNDDFTINDLVELIDAKFDNPLRADVLEFIKNPKFSGNSLAQLLRKRPASIMKWFRDKYGYENTGHQDVRENVSAVTMVLRLMRDQSIRFEDSLYAVNKYLRTTVDLVKSLRLIHGDLGAKRIRYALIHGNFNDGDSYAHRLSRLISEGIEEDTCADILDKYLESDRFTPPQPPDFFNHTVEKLKKRPDLQKKFMEASRNHYKQNLWDIKSMGSNEDKLEFLDYLGVRPPVKAMVDMLRSDSRTSRTAVEDHLQLRIAELGWFRRAGYDMQDPAFMELVANGRVNEVSGHRALSAIFYCLENGVAVSAAKDALKSIIHESDSPVALEPGEFEEEIKKYVPEMADDWADFVDENSARESRKAASRLLDYFAGINPFKRDDQPAAQKFLEFHLPRLKDAGFTQMEKMLGIGLLLCDADPDLADGLEWVGVGDFGLSSPARQQNRDIKFPKRTLAEFVMSVFLYGKYEMQVSAKTARATYEWLDGTFDWDTIGQDAWSVMLVAWRKYDRAKYLRYLKKAASVTDNSTVWHRGQERPRTNRFVLLKHLLFAVAKDGSDADMQEIFDTVRFTSAEKRLSETRDMLRGYYMSDFDINSDMVGKVRMEETVTKLRRLIMGGQNESAGHVITDFGSFIYPR